jgi:hypothetical protein
MNALYKWYALFASFFVMISSSANPTASHALLAAAEAGDIPAMEEALNDEADVNFQDDSLPNDVDGEAEGDTPLILAVQNDNIEAVEFLLSHPKTNINGTNKRGWTPLMMAAYKSDPTLAELLIARGAYIHAQTSRGECALGLACNSANLTMIALLLEGQNIEFSPAIINQIPWLYLGNSRIPLLTKNHHIISLILYMATAVKTLEHFNAIIESYSGWVTDWEDLLNKTQEPKERLRLQRMLSLHERTALQTKSRVTSLSLHAGAHLINAARQAKEAYKAAQAAAEQAAAEQAAAEQAAAEQAAADAAHPKRKYESETEPIAKRTRAQKEPVAGRTRSKK